MIKISATKPFYRQYTFWMKVLKVFGILFLFSSVYFLGWLTATQPERKARIELEDTSFDLSDVFEGFKTYIRNFTVDMNTYYEFNLQFYNGNFSNVGYRDYSQVDEINFEYLKIKLKSQYTDSDTSDNLLFSNFTLQVKRSFFSDDLETSRLNVIITAHGEVYYSDINIRSDIFIDFNEMVTEITIACF